MRFSLVLLLIFAFTSVSQAKTTKPAIPKYMPKKCQEYIATELKKDGEDAYLYVSESETFEDLMTSIKDAWSSSKSSMARFDVCGSSNFFHLIIDKKSCKIEELESGDSDGEC